MLVPPNVKDLIALALEEDLGRGDLSALAIPENREARAKIIARQAVTVSGSWLIQEIAKAASVTVKIETLAPEGTSLKTGETLAQIGGNARELLSLERTWLNFLQRTCGIATQAAALKARAPQLRIIDTRKTLPGWRFLDKYSVRMGGLFNHRFGLDGGILIKENHIRAAGSIDAAISGVKAVVPHGLKIQVEVTSRDEAFAAINSGAEALLLDNFAARDLGALVKEIRARAPQLLLEASGGIDANNLADYAVTGVDLVSMGALTHSVKGADLSLLFEFL